MLLNSVEEDEDGNKKAFYMGERVRILNHSLMLFQFKSEEFATFDSYWDDRNYCKILLNGGCYQTIMEDHIDHI